MNNRKYLQCPKCKYFSGEDWSQCVPIGGCPLEESPHYDENVYRIWGGLVEFTQAEYEKYRQDDWRN